MVPRPRRRRVRRGGAVVHVDRLEELRADATRERLQAAERGLRARPGGLARRRGAAALTRPLALEALLVRLGAVGAELSASRKFSRRGPLSVKPRAGRPVCQARGVSSMRLKGLSRCRRHSGDRRALAGRRERGDLQGDRRRRDERGALLVASPAGVVRPSQAGAVGSRIAVSGDRATVVGRAAQATIRGIVVRAASARRSSSRATGICSRPHRARGLAAPRHDVRRPGTVVSARRRDRERPARGGRRGRGRPGRAQLDLGAGDDEGRRRGSVTLDRPGADADAFRFPAGLTLPASLVGQTVTIHCRSRTTSRVTTTAAATTAVTTGGGDD